jgi:hypothetical protein
MRPVTALATITDCEMGDGVALTTDAARRTARHATEVDTPRASARE